MSRYRIWIEFDGTPFMGLQRQSHGPSVQQALEEAVKAITGEDVVVAAAGRTDAGVHALAMQAHFDSARGLEPFRMMEALNARLRPAPIAVLDCAIVPDDWHARFSCIGRHYVYRILNRRAPLALERDRCWHIKRPMDHDAMHDAAGVLIGSHDFTTFRSAHCQAQSPVKTLDQLDVSRAGDVIMVRAAARSFLHHQVRSMVGCLAMVGQGQWSADDLADALAARDRQALGLNAPPQGLYFAGAIYPE